MTNQQPERQSLGALISDIRGLHPLVEKLIEQFRQEVAEFAGAHPADGTEKSDLYWKLTAFTDSLARARLFLEQNLSSIETMGLLAVTRYMFELTVWLKLIKADSRYGLVYYSELLKKQLDYYTRLRNNAIREMAFLRDIDTQEGKLMEARLEEAMLIPDEEHRKEALSRLGADVMHEVDRIASRRFSLYAEQAQTNGYGYQANLVETKALPDIGKAIAELERQMSAYERESAPAVRDIVPKRWRWNDQAALVGMEDEYDFIYSYTSRLLHATPASLTTNSKDLEPDEVRAFLKYFRVRLLDVMEMATEVLAANRRLADASQR